MTIALSPHIHAFPIRHGKAPFAMAARRLLWEGKWDALAIALPASLREEALAGVEALPSVRALVIRVEGEAKCYLPFDPCDAYIEGMRQARQRRLPVHFIEDDSLLDAPLLQPLPDAYLVQGIGTGRYLELARELLAQAEPDARIDRRQRFAAQALRRLQRKHERILLLCDFPLLLALQASFPAASIEAMLAEAGGTLSGTPGGVHGQPASEADGGRIDIRSYPVKPELLYFALGELPFYAAEMEKERLDPLASPLDYLDLIKKIFSATRESFLDEPGEGAAISVKKIQTALIFLRNLAVQQGRLTPDLADLVEAAKGVFGNAFAAKVIEAARRYPYSDSEEAEAGFLEIGKDHIREPEGALADGEPLAAFNLLEDEPKTWKTIRLKKEPDREKQRRYRYAWDARGMCSHTPEDERIEGFNRAVRRRSRDLDLQGFARTEKLTTSLRDGIDVRETLRNWTTGGIYVREIPPAKGRVDTVVILFDVDHDERYPTRNTWYAEHDEESTLVFFATDPLDKMIGPGIAESEYGGLSLLFPPRPVPNVFDLPAKEFGFANLAEQLLYGALINTRERVVACVSQTPPGLRLKRMAARNGKRLSWVPMGSFSAETLRRLRKFHVLNGKHVRAWAPRFIPD
ncbi:MAG: hypothetical protein JF616_08930 [Fibrobacteres bacterium]|nr:hypothetical protein [Fibrobacterota bacterium]